MPSLMQCVLEDITNPGTSMTEEECLATLDLDATAISNVDGGWETVDVGDPANPHHDELTSSDFLLHTPPVYERKGFIIVRGTRDDNPVWFVYEPAGVGIH